jgi:hypothetical protein
LEDIFVDLIIVIEKLSRAFGSGRVLATIDKSSPKTAHYVSSIMKEAVPTDAPQKPIYNATLMNTTSDQQLFYC